jgi:uncharacterized protein YndB with AHSA1/START domain
MTDNTADREFRITRILPAPVEKVWRVWTDPDLIKDWWGPEGHTTIIKKMEVVENGEWLFIIQGPDRKTYSNRAIFTEIVPLKKLAFEHYNPDFVTLVEFTAKDNETSITWAMIFQTPEKRQTLIDVFNAEKGLNQTINKLIAYLKKQ